MVAQMTLVILVMLLVKYTIEFGERTRSPLARRLRRMRRAVTRRR
jgi:hypothetical protein